jgi:hypothetical protein
MPGPWYVVRVMAYLLALALQRIHHVNDPSKRFDSAIDS